MSITTHRLIMAGQHLARLISKEGEFGVCIRMLRIPRYTSQLLDHTCFALGKPEAKRLRDQMAYFRSEASAEDAINHWADQGVGELAA